jgi:hypothetical protein
MKEKISSCASIFISVAGKNLIWNAEPSICQQRNYCYTVFTCMKDALRCVLSACCRTRTADVWAGSLPSYPLHHEAFVKREILELPDELFSKRFFLDKVPFRFLP